MTTPPPIGWRPTPPSGPTPPPQGGPYGQQPLPGPAGPWPHHPAPPPKKNNTVKWLLGAVALLLVIAISVGATLLFTRDGGGGETPGTASSPPPTASTAPPSEIASANDTGPIAVIKEDPTCATYRDLNNALSDIEANGWGDQHATLGAAPEWTPDQRSRVQSVAAAMLNSADQVVKLAKQTPHRVVRELYEQFIAYSRAYARSIDSYVPADNALADATVSLQNSLVGVCTAIEQGSARSIPTLAPLDLPSAATTAGDPVQSERFLARSTPVCATWDVNGREYAARTQDWENLISRGVPPSQWSSEDGAIHRAALLFMTTFANQMESTGRASGNPVFEDLALLAAVYLRAFVSTGDDYTDAASWLIYTTLRLNNSISSACKAAAG